MSKNKAEKPAKPSEDYPLFPHDSGYWAKKIKGKLIYFGRWDDPDLALKTYQRERIDWEARRNPRVLAEARDIDSKIGVRVGDGINLFLEHCDQKVKRGELGVRSYLEYKSTGKKLLTVIDRHFPLNSMQPDDWGRCYAKFSKGKSPVTVLGEVNRVRVMMNWLEKNRYLDRKPFYGAEFDKPSKLTIRRSRANSGKKWFSADEIRKLITTTHTALKPMILLGINCGFGNSDCAKLERQWIDLETGWIEYSRPKTGVFRRIKIWPETVAAVQAWLDVRTRINNRLVFVTRQGNPWSNPDSAECAITKAFKRISEELSVYIPGRNFYGLRRTFETIGGRSKDQIAVNSIMGHVDDSMAGVYRQEIDDTRLVAVSELVRNWLFETTVKE